ncbi:response regulator [Chromobacterium haemolyticum]|nr:response regulator [Chromobacterium haemolyticum]
MLAEENSRAKTEFLANMSHELRTPPLHAILGFTEMGQARSRGQNDDKMAQYFSRIQSSGNRLLTLLNDLLDLAKMEVGRMEYTMSRNNLCQCLRDICDEMTPLAALNEIRIDLNCSPEPLNADIDPFRIGQVMRNLLSNAIKFSPRGGEIGVNACLRQDADGENILVTVEDAGPGVPESELESIFDKFIQSRAAPRPAPAAPAWGWPFAAKSSPLTMDASSPAICRRTARCSPSSFRAPGQPAPRRTPTMPHKLLLVDDEPFNLELMAELLQDAGHEVVQAEDGETALAILQREGETFSTVLLDKMMPGISGFDVLRRIKSEPRLEFLPVIMQTAMGAASSVQEGLAAGAFYYLTKPFSP